MDKANQALRRSSVKLKSLNSGHSDLYMIISDIGKMRSAFKSFHLAQSTTWEDLATWASKEKNIALQATFHHLVDLCFLWSEAQLEFIAGLKKFKLQFERILESELLLDKSKAYLSSCEQKDNKIKKEMKKANSKGNCDDAKQLSDRHVETQALVNVAQTEVNSKTLENETIKVMLVKEGLLNVSTSYLNMVGKANIIFHAHQEVSKYLPDVHDKEIEEIRYSGAEAANVTLKAKEAILVYKSLSDIESAPPPPYSSTPSYPALSVSQGMTQYRMNSTDHFSYTSLSPNQQNYEYPSDHRRYELPPRYDLPPVDHTENLEGAIGGLNISDNNGSYRQYSNI